MSWQRAGVLGLACLHLCCASGAEQSSERYERLDALAALWSFYKFRYITNGRVVSLDEDSITTSEGQGYAMLRAVWSDDEDTFQRVWEWTLQSLRVRGDRLFAWKWKERVLDIHTATDADTDIALALVLAARRFAEPGYERQALEIIQDIWRLEILALGDAHYPTAGDWARKERFPVIHVGYLAPYAYTEFAKVDPEHPWPLVAETSYDILHWLYFDQGLALPPEKIWVDRKTGELRLRDPRGGYASFGYDAFPIFWRVALDASWNWRREGRLHERMLAPLEAAWERDARIYDRYQTDGRALSRLEALPLYATAHSLAEIADPDFGLRLRAQKLDALWDLAIAGQETPYYLHNWLWFDEALSLGEARRFDELFGFLRPFDFRAFRATLPAIPLAACFLLLPLAHLTRGSRWHRIATLAFLAAAFAVCLRYLWWRGANSLNFVEPLGPFISVSLWFAELYCFVSVVLLLVQVGLGGSRERRRPDASGFQPSVDVLIPIYREPVEILARTLLAARALRYPCVEIHVLDDGHRNEVQELARSCGARYHPGPREHAKAGNLNHALSRTEGELIAVFDTDHVPNTSFLEETVPWFRDPGVGFVQTPHQFRNPDIFQRAFRLAGRIPNEQDLFNRGIQSARDAWGGAFFVGSGAVFRRRALAAVGGFKLLSITEDIHTSQHLHGAGWQSVYVNDDLAVGLSAESLASYIVQRRRWMLGCLQIFFRDNPLFCEGLSARHRVGYFASLYHFFFPLARLIFWLTPLYYLLFHLHPILSEVSVLTALLLPYLVVLPMITSVLVPGWPRPFWGAFYENAVSAPLVRSMVDLLLPKSQTFRATPKGIVTQARRFDWRSARWTLLSATITALAIAKGLWEFHSFGIERDAYFFNMAWASYNLLFLLGALMLAWERPQRRAEERVLCELPVRIHHGGTAIGARSWDVSIAGCSLVLPERWPLPDSCDLEIGIGKEEVRVHAALVYHERMGSRERVGMRFLDPGAETLHALQLGVFAETGTWKRARVRETRSRIGLATAFLVAYAAYFRPLRLSRRRHPRRLRLARLWLRGRDEERRVWLRNTSARGLGLLVAGKPPRIDGAWRISPLRGPVRWGRAVHARRRYFFLWYVGIEYVDKPQSSREPEWELAP